MTVQDIQNLIVTTATAYGVDPRLALEIATREDSSFDPNAVSSAGAVGIFQLMPSVQSDYGVTDPTDPTQNVYAGIQYIAALVAQFGGNLAEAIGAYDWGPGNVQNAIALYGANWLSHAPGETQSYVPAILAAIGSDYSVSIGTPAAGSPAPSGFTPAAVSPAAAAAMSTGELFAIAALGLIGIFALGLFQD